MTGDNIAQHYLIIYYISLFQQIQQQSSSLQQHMNIAAHIDNSLTQKYHKLATPTFKKRGSSKINSFQCDFDDQMINENIGVNPVLSINSPHRLSKHLCSHWEEQPREDELRVNQPKDNEEMEMIYALGVSALKEIDNKENIQQIQYHEKVKNSQNANISEGKTRKVKLKKKKENSEKSINEEKIVTQSKITEKIKADIAAALTERTPVAKNLSKNIEEYICKKQKKLRELKIEQEIKAMRQCTFTPKTRNNDKNNSATPRRKFEDFLESQEAFTTRVELKRQQLKTRQEQLKKSQEPFKPAINKSNNKSNNKKKPAYERLYELKDQKKNYEVVLEQRYIPKPSSRSSKIESQVKPYELIMSKTMTNANSVASNPRKTPVGELLYEDAMRRSNFKKVVVKNHLTSSSMFSSNLQTEGTSKSPRKANKRTEKLVTQKLIRQYCYALEKYELLPRFLENNSQTGESQECRVDGFDFTHGQNFHKQSLQPEKEQDLNMDEISLANFQNILRELGFLLYQEEDTCELAYRERALAYEAYEILEEYGVNIKNICVLLLGLIGVFSIDPLNFGTEENSDEEGKSKNFQLDEKEGRKIQKYFDLLHCNRLTSSHKCKTSKIEPPVNKDISKSKHKQYTAQLASKYRLKMVEKTNQRFLSNSIDVVIPSENVLTHEDMLVLNQIGKNLSIQKQRRKKIDNQLDEECTFHPKINKKTPQGELQPDHMGQCLQQPEEMKKSKGMNKSKQLYEYAKNRQQMLEGKLKLQKSEIEEKQCATPREVKKLDKKEKEGHFPKAKDVDKTIARMHEARKRRQQKQQFLKKGWHLNQKKTTNADKKQANQFFFQYYKSAANQDDFSSNQIAWRPATDRSPAKNCPINQCIKKQPQQQFQNQQRQPFLMIDVNMENETHQIQFFTGDEQRLEAIVDEFCLKHDLDQISKQQLLSLVVTEISIFLNNVGVESTTSEM